MTTAKSDRNYNDDMTISTFKKGIDFKDSSTSIFDHVIQADVVSIFDFCLLS